MNRAKRRELAKKINTPEKLERVVDKVVKERTEDIRKEYYQKLAGYVEVFVVMMCYVLDLEEIPKERIPQIASRVLFNIDSFRTGELVPSDYDAIKKEIEDMGVKL
jgi:hypothetical protein